MAETKRHTPVFGPGGNSESFYAAGKKHTADAPAWLRSIGLDAYEYQGGNGITASPGTLLDIGRAAAEAGILMSVHSPYYISLSGTDPEKRLKSLDYIRQSLDAAAALGADIIVIHAGSAAKIERREAMRLAADTLCRALAAFPDNGIAFGIETMGKTNQLGTLDEVIELCRIDKRLAPVVDFGHINASAHGEAFHTAGDFSAVFEKIAAALGDDAARYLHCHFSRIEWTAGGEKKHLRFDDPSDFGPDYRLLMEAVCKDGLCPRIICESAGTMAEDSLTMKNYFLSINN